MASTTHESGQIGQLCHEQSLEEAKSAALAGQSSALVPQPSRDAAPNSAETLRRWIHGYTGVKIARQSICQGHNSTWEFFRRVYLERPSLSLVLGSRGGGKSFLSALDTHITSRYSPKHGTRILGGSRAQSEQIYRALQEAVFDGNGALGSDRGTFHRLLKEEAVYRNGSDVSILSASSTSVRGPHVPSLKLDEVDEIPTELREAAMGMCMERHGSRASVMMSSTWHRVDGPMSGLLERAHAGEFPLFTFCAFEVLEHCSDSRSGPFLENCPSCPLVKWCHDVPPGVAPKAKRSEGHYAIDSLIQKVHSTSARVFESDYLCKGPRSDGLWFPRFQDEKHVALRAEYDHSLPVHISIDSGVFTGAVFFQVAKELTSTGTTEDIRVFADYLAENLPAEQHARAILEMARTRCQGRMDVLSTDPAGGSRNPVGPTVIGEFERVGLRPLQRWPYGSVADGLALVESFVDPAEGRSRLTIHPRCLATIRAFQNYRRAKRAAQWQDYPEDPQHPHEELIDALRGGLRLIFPDGRLSQPYLARVPARQVF
jgi:hypothetical protein